MEGCFRIHYNSEEVYEVVPEVVIIVMLQKAISSDLSRRQTKHLVRGSCQKVRWDPPLHKYYLDRRKIEAEEARWVAIDVAQKEKDLREEAWVQIYLGQNFLNDKSCEFFAKAQWPFLINIILQWNCVGDRGCKMLVQAKWKNLAHLGLARTGITEVGCGYLARGVWEDCNITFNLYGNRIEKHGYRIMKDRFGSSGKIYCDSQFID